MAVFDVEQIQCVSIKFLHPFLKKFWSHRGIRRQSSIFSVNDVGVFSMMIQVIVNTSLNLE